MYLVSATIGPYNSTDYLHFVAERRRKTVHDLELKEKKKCASRYDLRVRVGITCQILLKRPVLLMSFSVASIIVLFVTTVNSE